MDYKYWIKSWIKLVLEFFFLVSISFFKFIGKLLYIYLQISFSCYDYLNLCISIVDILFLLKQSEIPELGMPNFFFFFFLYELCSNRMVIFQPYLFIYTSLSVFFSVWYFLYFFICFKRIQSASTSENSTSLKLCWRKPYKGFQLETHLNFSLYFV